MAENPVIEIIEHDAVLTKINFKARGSAVYQFEVRDSDARFGLALSYLDQPIRLVMERVRHEAAMEPPAQKNGYQQASLEDAIDGSVGERARSVRAM